MKSCLLYILIALAFCPFGFVCGQAIENSQSIELRCGKTLSIGDYGSLRYRHTTTTSIDLSVGFFINGLQKNGLQYCGYGVDLMGEYYTPVGDNTDHWFELKAGMGLTACVDNESWVYKDLPFIKRLNYGLAGELTGECRLSENFSFTTFIQQKILFNHNLSRYEFSLGLGIKLNLD